MFLAAEVSNGWGLAAVVVATAPGTIMATAAWRSSRASKTHAERASKSTSELSEAVATNHGLRPGEYLEKIADVQNDQAGLTVRLDRLAGQFAVHVEDDRAAQEATQVRLDEVVQLLKN